MWFDGYGEFEGKILELSLNEKEQIDKEDASGFDLYMLEGLVMNEPRGEWSDLKNNLAISV